MMSRFGKWLSDWLYYKNMTQAELAEAIHTSQSSISFHITGKRNPTYRSVKRYCDFFGEKDVYGVYELTLMG